MAWLKLIGLCVLAAAMVMVLSQMHPRIAALLSIVFGLMVVAVSLGPVTQYVAQIQSFLTDAALDGAYGKVILKAMGIVLVTQLACEVCREMDASGVARRVEFLGRIALLGLAVPVFISLAEMAVNVLG